MTYALLLLLLSQGQRPGSFPFPNWFMVNASTARYVGAWDQSVERRPVAVPDGWVVSWDDENDNAGGMFYTRIRQDGVLLDTLGRGSWRYTVVGYDGTDYLLVRGQWMPGTVSSVDLFCCRMTADGQFLDDSGGFRVTRETPSRGVGRYDFAFNGTDYLLAYNGLRWIVGQREVPSGLRAFMIHPSGVVDTLAPGWIRDTTRGDWYVRVASDGNDFVVAWAETLMANNEQDVYAARIGANGWLLDSVPIPVRCGPSPAWAKWPLDCLYANGRYIVPWCTSSGLVFATRIDTNGTVIDTFGLPLTPYAGSRGLRMFYDGRNYACFFQVEDTVYGMRFDTSLAPVDTGPRALVAPLYSSREFSVAQSQDRYLLVYDSGGTSYHTLNVNAAVVDSGLEVVSQARCISQTAASQRCPAVCPFANGYVTAWLQHHNPGQWDSGWDVVWQRISCAGEPIDPVPQSLGEVWTYPRMAWNRVHGSLVGLLAGRQRGFLNWYHIGSAGRPAFAGQVSLSTFQTVGVSVDTLGNRLVSYYDDGWHEVRIASSSGHDRIASVDYPVYTIGAASDGNNHLVCWASSDAGLLLGRVYPLQQDSFVVNAMGGAGYLRDPNVVYGAGCYLVAWIAAPSADLVRLRCARVAPNGTVLDTAGITVDGPFAGFLPAVTSDPDMRNCMAAWFDGTNFRILYPKRTAADTGRYDLYSASVDPASGSVSVLCVSDPSPYHRWDPAACWDGNEQTLMLDAGFVPTPFNSSRVFGRFLGTAHPVHDVAALDILAPTGKVHLGDTIIPQAVVANCGGAPETFPVILHVGGTYVDTQEVFVPIGRNDTASFRAWLAESVGVYATSCVTMLAGDVNPANDSCSDSVNVLPGVAVADQVPAALMLSLARSNPFRGEAVLRYGLPRAGAVTIDVFSSNGALVRRLCDSDRPAGYHTAVWDGCDNAGRQAGTGVYYCLMSVGGRELRRKLVRVE